MAIVVLSIDGFPIDATISETHSLSSSVTEYPVESGANLTDHIRALPIEVTMEAIVSDTPLMRMKPLRDSGRTAPQRAAVASSQALTPQLVQTASALKPDVAKPSQAALDHLVKMHAACKPVHIVTSLKTYENMAVTSIEIPRSKDQTGGLWFTVQFRQVQIVENTRVRRTDVPRGQGGGGLAGTDALAKGVDLSAPIVWRKGKPPGKDEIYAIEYVYYQPKEQPSLVSVENNLIGHGYFKIGPNGPVELSNKARILPNPENGFSTLSELNCFARDMERDRRILRAKQKDMRRALQSELDEKKRVKDFLNNNSSAEDLLKGDKVDRSKPPVIPRKWAGKK